MRKLWIDQIPGLLPDDTEGPFLDPYILQDGHDHAAVIICPGGGYAGRAYHEGEPVAGWLNSIGISALVLQYRVKPYQYPYPQMDAARAVQVVRYYSENHHIDKEKIGVLGFSAGGHLAAFTAVHHSLDRVVDSDDDIGAVSSRPDFMILGYPVITMEEHAHGGSRKNLLGDNPDTTLTDICSIEKNVNGTTPPAFIWHTADDASVPVENSILLARALSQHAVPFEFHVFESGRHGLGIKYETPDVRSWMGLCEKWLIRNKFTG
jgi:acetyl esterase/lipase